MNRLLLILVCAAVPLRGAEAPPEAGPVIAPGADDAAWRPLFAALAAKGGVEAAFTELRWFSFRAAPVELKGEMRFSPALGLSLLYFEPERRLVVADAKGLLVRDARGRAHELPAGTRGLASIAAMLSVMRFDLASLERTFEVHGARAGSAWRLDFVPRDPGQARVLGRLVVYGEDEAVRRLEFRHSAKQRVEIVIGETRTGVEFGSGAQRRFFR